MMLSFVSKKVYIIALLAVPALALMLPFTTTAPTAYLPKDRVNLALRRTADALLRASADSTSRIPAVEQTNAYSWRVQLIQDFSYDKLPGLLQESLDRYQIHEPYTVAVRRCQDGIIDLGYFYKDATENSTVSCTGREKPEGCHYIEVTFIAPTKKSMFWVKMICFFSCLAGSLLILWRFRQKQEQASKSIADEGDSIEWLNFGHSRLDVANQVLIANGTTQQLTFREAKLLKLFVMHADYLLERDLIIQQVWADEGVLVGRSVDMFVSRLRKKLAPDPSVAIRAVHGVGYRLDASK